MKIETENPINMPYFWEDYWFMLGKNPPRSLNGPIQKDDAQSNAFGRCSTQQGDGVTSNSCTYVSFETTNSNLFEIWIFRFSI
jgi:hypothetical protein